jgi:DNA-binding NarL/FixJ family response regulator
MTNIIIFDDNNEFRQSLEMLLNSEPNFSVKGTYANCKAAYAITKQTNPDVVIMDIDMPELSGIEGVRLVKEAKPNTEIIMHTVFEDDGHLFEALCAGANGYLLKKNSLSKLIEAIKDSMEGGAPFSPGIARRVLAHFHKPKSSYSLTPREKEILTLCAQGFSYKMIAPALDISLETVKSHFKNIFAELHVSCGTEAVAKALREGLI